MSIPAKETTLESVSRLILDAKKFRIEEHHPAFHFPSGEILPENLVLAYDGTIGRIYAPDGLRKGLPPKGGIQGDACHQIKLIHLMPLLLTFRGTSSLHSSYVVGDMQPTGRSLSIDGSRCDEYHIQFSPNRIERFWLDPGKDYVLKRHQRQIDQTDVAYRHDANWGWVPTSWKRTEYTATKKVAISTTINVVDLRINEAQPDYLFAPEFPPGTHVEDQRDNKSYIIQTDGSMREASRSGELLPGSTPQPGVGWVRRHQWLLITGGAAFIGVFGYLIYRQRSRGR